MRKAKNKYIKDIKEIVSFIKQIEKNKNLCFRGQLDSTWKIEPSITRQLQNYQMVIYEDFLLESKLDKEEIKELNLQLETDSEYEWLMLCQHYGVPTRLLDWTRNILVALFFACYDEKNTCTNKDGVIFICDSSDYTNNVIHDTNLRESHELNFIEPSIQNPRIEAQKGCFMIWGYEDTKKYHLEKYIKINKNKKYFLSKLLINSSYKKIFLEQLDKEYGINKDTIYANEIKTNEKEWEKKKKALNILSLYTTQCTEEIEKNYEEKIFESFNLRFKNAFGECVSLRTLKLNGLISKFNKININKFIASI